MKIKGITIVKLSDMICGNEPFTYFPYRTSYKLTEFFTGLGLNYIHDGTTRNRWVQDVLRRLNDQSSREDKSISDGLCKVITSLVDPDYFWDIEGLDHKKAVEDVNKAIKSSELFLTRKNNGQYSLERLDGVFVSTEIERTEVTKVITFTPSVFTIPKGSLDPKLVSVMMPFGQEYDETYKAIQEAIHQSDMRSERADKIWKNSAIIQDIFELIFLSQIVIIDFSEKNPNVMYEAGIAHTLGKTVIPISRSLEDIPFDLAHHRILKYLPNTEGYCELTKMLRGRIQTIRNR